MSEELERGNSQDRRKRQRKKKRGERERGDD